MHGHKVTFVGIQHLLHFFALGFVMHGSAEVHAHNWARFVVVNDQTRFGHKWVDVTHVRRFEQGIVHGGVKFHEMTRSLHHNARGARVVCVAHHVHYQVLCLQRAGVKVLTRCWF